MSTFQFIGEYQGRSSNVGAVRYVNLYPHKTQDNRVVVFGTPGLESMASLGGSPVRGMHVMNGVLYAVSGNVLYKVANFITITAIGTLATATGMVSMADNGQQLMLVDGSKGYIYTPTSGVFAAIGSPNFPVADTVCFLDGYFIVNAHGTNTWFYSTLYDGTSWAALDYNAAESSPDNVVAVASTMGLVYVFGSQTTEVWYDAGDPLTVFSRINGMLSNVGLLAIASVCKVGDSGGQLCWLATTPQGKGYIVSSTAGQQPVRLSNAEVEYQWSQYPTLSDAVAYGYAAEGHIFYVINFPSGNATWVYDFMTGAWHERSSNNGQHLGQCYAFFNHPLDGLDYHLVGSYRDGNLYSLNMDVYDENGQAIQRTLISPTLGATEKGLVSYQSLELDMERGMGLTSGQGSIPVIMLSWSNDGGHSWTDEITGGIGMIGDYTRRVVFRRLGRSFRRTFRIRISDPVKVIIISGTVQTK